MESYEKIWEQVLKFIKENTTEASYNTWFKDPLSIYKIDTENIYGCGKTNTVRKKDGKLRKNLGAGFKYY